MSTDGALGSVERRYENNDDDEDRAERRDAKDVNKGVCSDR